MLNYEVYELKTYPHNKQGKIFNGFLYRKNKKGKKVRLDFFPDTSIEDCA